MSSSIQQTLNVVESLYNVDELCQGQSFETWSLSKSHSDILLSIFLLMTKKTVLHQCPQIAQFFPRYFGFSFIFEGVSRHPVRNNCNLPTLARFTQPRPACLAGKVALYTTAVLGNVRTHLSLRKLKPNNKEKNYAIYGTGKDNKWNVKRICIFQKSLTHTIGQFFSLLFSFSFLNERCVLTLTLCATEPFLLNRQDEVA